MRSVPGRGITESPGDRCVPRPDPARATDHPGRGLPHPLRLVTLHLEGPAAASSTGAVPGGPAGRRRTATGTERPGNRSTARRSDRRRQPEPRSLGWWAGRPNRRRWRYGRPGVIARGVRPHDAANSRVHGCSTGTSGRNRWRGTSRECAFDGRAPDPPGGDQPADQAGTQGIRGHHPFESRRERRCQQPVAGWPTERQRQLPRTPLAAQPPPSPECPRGTSGRRCTRAVPAGWRRPGCCRRRCWSST